MSTLHHLEEIYRGEVVEPLGEILLRDGFGKAGLNYWIRHQGTVGYVSFSGRKRSGDQLGVQPTIQLLHRWLNPWLSAIGGVDLQHSRKALVEAKQPKLLRINADWMLDFEFLRPKHQRTYTGWDLADTSSAIKIRDVFHQLLPSAIRTARTILEDEWYYEDCRECTFRSNPERWILPSAKHFALMAIEQRRWGDFDASLPTFDGKERYGWPTADDVKRELARLAADLEPR